MQSPFLCEKNTALLLLIPMYFCYNKLLETKKLDIASQRTISAKGKGFRMETEAKAKNFIEENIDADKFLKEFADGWLESEKKLSMDVILERKIMSKACKSAVKANQYLTKADILFLMKELDKAEDGFTCPHGRPISVKFTENEIRRKLGAIGYEL